MIVAAAAIGIGCFWAGFFLAHAAGASPGPSIVITGTGFFLATLVFAPKYGLLVDWNRRRRAVPQEIKEDVLGAILRSEQEWVPINDVVRHIASNKPKIRRAIIHLIRQDLLDQKGTELRLTSQGRREGRRLLRAHRIWETYLDRMGTPANELHGQAHKLEHMNDEQTIDYLDDKLGHPLKDPHGSTIPEDFVDFEELSEVRSSLLREGFRAEIVRVEDVTLQDRLRPGAKVLGGPRSADGIRWSLITEDGATVELSHDQADAVFVHRVESEPA